MHGVLREARHVDIGHKRGVLDMTALRLWGQARAPRPGDRSTAPNPAQHPMRREQGQNIWRRTLPYVHNVCGTHVYPFVYRT